MRTGASCLHHLEVRVAVARVVVRIEVRMEPTRVSEREEMTRCRILGKIGVKKTQQQQLDGLLSAFTNISLYTLFPLSTPVIVYNTFFSPFPLVFTETPSMPVQRELLHSGEEGTLGSLSLWLGEEVIWLYVALDNVSPAGPVRARVL